MALRRMDWRGFVIVVENEPGSVREWRDAAGTVGRTFMRLPYGYFDDQGGRDGDELDVYVGPDPTATFVYVVHQLHPDGRPDEDKVFIDQPSEAAAKAAFLEHRSDGDRAYGGMSAIPVDDFTAKLRRRTGDGKIRHSMTAKTTFTVPAFRFQLIAGSELVDSSNPEAVIARLKSAIGRWSRGMTMGYKARGNVVFSAPLMAALLDVVRKRGDKVSICQDHKSAFVAQTGQAAPSLGFFYGLAAIDNGTLAAHWSWDGQGPPDVVDEDGTPRHGLYCRLGEITPLGYDLKEGLANYSGLSPTFELNTEIEDGTTVPIFLIDFAATSAGYQGGCALNFHILTSVPVTTMAVGPCPVCAKVVDAFKAGDGKWHTQNHYDGTGGFKECRGGGWLIKDQSAVKMASTGGAPANGVNSMNPEMMKKMGFAEGAQPTTEEKLAAYAKHAMGEATPEELKAMAADLEKIDEPGAKAMAKKFTALAGAEPFKGDETPAEEKAEIEEIRKSLSLPATMSRVDVLRAHRAGSVTMGAVTGMVNKAVTDAIAQRDAATAATQLEQKAKDLGAEYKRYGADDGQVNAIIAMARIPGNLEHAQKIVNSAPGKVATQRLPVGAGTGAIPGAPGKGGNVRSFSMGGQVVEVEDAGGEFAAKVEEFLATAKKDPVVMARLTRVAGKGANEGMLYAAAMRVVSEEHPEVYAAYKAGESR